MRTRSTLAAVSLALLLPGGAARADNAVPVERSAWVEACERQMRAAQEAFACLHPEVGNDKVEASTDEHVRKGWPEYVVYAANSEEGGELRVLIDATPPPVPLTPAATRWQFHRDDPNDRRFGGECPPEPALSLERRTASRSASLTAYVGVRREFWRDFARIFRRAANACLGAR